MFLTLICFSLDHPSVSVSLSLLNCIQKKKKGNGRLHVVEVRKQATILKEPHTISILEISLNFATVA